MLERRGFGRVGARTNASWAKSARSRVVGLCKEGDNI